MSKGQEFLVTARFFRSDVKTAKKKSNNKITEQTGTKILVRNIPFQATLQEVTELFKYVYYHIFFVKIFLHVMQLNRNFAGRTVS